MRKSYLILLIILWVILLLSSFIWIYSLIKSGNEKIVLNKSQSFFNQILSTRDWNAQHGGVYVPVTESTQPNPYLEDSLRDIITQDGMLLTMINPAYMTRQIAELSLSKYDLKFHITSLKPIRPDNYGDEWETSALKLFEAGTTEIIEFIQGDSISRYRYMAPLITQQSCLKCHSKQGYKTGDIRGGISISFPAEIYTTAMHKQFVSMSIIHLFVLLIGIAGITIFYRLSKRYILDIKNKNAELININATKDKFFTIIAHDLRSPFNSILGYSKLLLDDYDNLTDVQRRKFINEIGISSKNSYHLLDNLLLWAQSQQDGIEINKTKLNLNTLIIDAIEPYMPAARMKGISVNTKFTGELMANADVFTVLTIISNLFNNAVKFTPLSGIINIDAKIIDGKINIFISDNGIGISKENLSKLFLIEEDTSTIGTNNEKGTGLGLILCKEFVELNGGGIWIESVPGQGTTVTITLPEYV
jgi:signal transduction histidine kinase